MATPQGVPQGATISPLLVNVYPHSVDDPWVQHWRRRHVRGDMIVVRCADDTIVGFEHEADAERFLAALPVVYPNIPVQRCWAHKIRNIVAGVRAADRSVI